ncbi:MAG: hypothetical protein SCALA702_36110 [Melioribacteraceae bacterium]|nr:MAG: hypothetical protein SCALA702_36110 [Melioribacteraceae bacterium]
MKKSLFAIVLLMAAFCLNAQNNELRGVWITNVDSDVMFTDAKIAEAMDYLASININVVFPVVWNKGYPLFPSETMDEYFGVSIWPTFAGRDPLQTIITEAHRVGIEVIPWFEFGFATSYSLNGGHIIAEYPDWALKNNQGQLVVKNGFDWMSGLHPEVQEFMTKLVLEVVDKYDVDGIQGDDRLPAMPVEGGYETSTVELYKAEHGGADPPSNYSDSQWKRWRADKLNEYFLSLRDSVKSRGEQFIVSSAPSVYPWGYDNYLQDSKTWVTDGIVDNFIPQLYRQSVSSYRAELNNSLSHIPEEKKDIFFAGVLAKAGSYVISPSLLISSVQANRDAGVLGETYFFYEALRRNDNALGDTLKAIFYQDKATLPYRNGQYWRTPANIINEDDPEITLTGNWQIFQSNSGFEPGILLTNDTEYASIEYDFEISQAAYYDLYAYIVPNTVNSESVPYTIYDGADSNVVYIDQKDANNSGWHKLVTLEVQSGTNKLLRISNEGVEAGKYITADAAMLILNRKLSPDVVLSVEEENRVADVQPNSFSLEQNYPNPFNPETTIRFNLSEAGFTKLVVYDVLGREVATVLEQELKAGIHSVKFNSAGLSSGIYFYTLKTGSQISTRKMTLLK